MKLFEDTTIWCKLELSFSKDEDFIENFEKIFNYYEHEYNPEAEMRFYIDVKIIKFGNYLRKFAMEATEAFG